MGLLIRILQTTIVVFILTNFTVSSTSSIHDDEVLNFSGRRNLLQTKRRCSLDFEHMDYTNISTKCRRPFPPDQCCPAFKEFACPISSYINDLRTDCSTTMFAYLHSKCEFPEGLFSSLCRDGPKGLECPPSSSSASTELPLQQSNGESRSSAKSIDYLKVVVISTLHLTFLVAASVGMVIIS